MAKAFKKGELVTFICDWDRKGTVSFQHAVVYSCGAKQMVLTNEETGEELGRHYRPEVGSMTDVDVIGSNGKVQGYRAAGGTFKRMTDEQAVAACLEIAAAIRVRELAHFERCLAGNHGECYDRSIRKDMEQLHEFRAVEYSAAVAAIRSAVKTK